MSPDRNHILRRRKLPRRGDPLDQAQRNFILMRAMQQFVPFVTGGESTCPITKSSDLIAQAIRGGSSVQDRILSGRQISAGTRESPESFQPLGISKPGRQSFQPRRLLGNKNANGHRSQISNCGAWLRSRTAPVSHQKQPGRNTTNAIKGKQKHSKINESGRFPPALNGLVAGSSPAGPTTFRPSGYAWRSRPKAKRVRRSLNAVKAKTDWPQHGPTPPQTKNIENNPMHSS